MSEEVDQAVEAGLRGAAATAAPVRFAVDAAAVAAALGGSSGGAAPAVPNRGTRWAIAAGFSGIAAAITAIVMVAGLTGAPRLSLADVVSAVNAQKWVKVTYANDQAESMWYDLQDGHAFAVRRDGEIMMFDDRANRELDYSPREKIITQQKMHDDTAATQPAKNPPTAWEEFIGPIERSMQRQNDKGASPGKDRIDRVEDTLNGKPAVRFDQFVTDVDGEERLFFQIWADPVTRLPVQEKMRLQPSEREQWHTDFSTATYTYPETGPADIYALGVPRDTRIVVLEEGVDAAAAPVIAAIDAAYQRFPDTYHAVVWQKQNYIEVTWRRGVDRWNAYYFWPQPNDPAWTADDLEVLTAWASEHTPGVVQAMLGKNVYFRRNPMYDDKGQPTVQLVNAFGKPWLLVMQNWPEMLAYPTKQSGEGTSYRAIPENAETPAGCIGLRHGGETNQRDDTYVDPTRDYLAVKHTVWQRKEGRPWTKWFEWTLIDTQVVNGRNVPKTVRYASFGDRSLGIQDSVNTVHVSLMPCKAEEIPADLLKVETLKAGAVEQK